MCITIHGGRHGDYNEVLLTPRCGIPTSLSTAAPYRYYSSCVSHETCCFFPAVRTNEFVRVGHSHISDNECTNDSPLCARVTARIIPTGVHTCSIVCAMGGAGSHALIIVSLLIGIISTLSSLQSTKKQSREHEFFLAVSCFLLSRESGLRY